ncbi:MAG: CRISPR-associated endonuclease Cas1 [Victivallaceae bacterium]|nr:CRISPR-associated endonuclease Cas1 [Victivallaceae bacterium]
MPTLTITRDTVSVRLHSERLELIRHSENGNENLERINVPLFDLERVIICGRPIVTLPVLHKLMRLQIPVVFVTSHGRWLGAIDSGNQTNAARRIRQYELFSNEQTRNLAATRLIYAKIRNSRRVLQRLAAARGETETIVQKDATGFLRNCCIKARRSTDSLDTLRGIEGVAAACYFRRLADFFPPELPFVERSRQPPLNAANSILSWSYTIVLGEIEAVLRSHGLDVGIGFLHTIEHSRPALALDLLETLRAPLCDMLALHLLNHKILRAEHFRFCSEDGGTYLNDDGKKPFFNAYEQAMTRKFTLSPGEPHVDFRKIIEHQVFAVIKILEGDEDAEFFIMP